MKRSDSTVQQIATLKPCKAKSGIGKLSIHTVKNVKHRQAVARFRISAHRFPVEVGRYANVEHKKRLCAICNSDDIGDEYHYFINCKNHKLENLMQRKFPERNFGN